MNDMNNYGATTWGTQQKQNGCSNLYNVHHPDQDSGMLDPYPKPYRHQNLTDWSLGHSPPPCKISSKSVPNFFSVIQPIGKQMSRSSN